MADAKSDVSEETDSSNVDVMDGDVTNEVVSDDIETEEVETFVEEPLEDAPHDPIQDYEEQDDRHPSLSSRVLTWLAVLFAGAGIALWGGPKLAPQLPEWAAPAAKFMTPGGDAAVRDVAALRTEVTEQLENAPKGPTAEELTALVQAELTDIQTQTDEKLAAIEAQLASADTSTMDARISTIETQVEGLSAELGALTTSVQTALSEGGSISEETLAEITSKSAEVEGVKAQLGEMTAQVSALTQRIEDAESAATERLEAAKAEAAQATERATQLAANTAFQAAFDDLTETASAGGPYATQLNALAELTDAELPAVLADNATSGVAALSTLKSQFTILSHDAIRASIKEDGAQGGSSASKLGAFLKSQVASRSLEPMDGDSTDAVLSRINAALGDGNLEAVTTEAGSLSEGARAPLSSWLDTVETRKSVLDTLATFGSQPS